MGRLLDGVRRFHAQAFPQRRQLFRRLARAQQPETLLITCADSRVVPELFTQTEPGELFLCRNVGNLVPAYGQALGGVSAVIEYAVMALEVKNIVICGHSDCGAMKALVRPGSLAGMPTVATWLRHAEAAHSVVRVRYPDLDGDALVQALVEQNVLTQLDHLRTHPAVAARLAEGRLGVHGWTYEIGTGSVAMFDPAAGRFVPLETAAEDGGKAEPIPAQTSGGEPDRKRANKARPDRNGGRETAPSKRA
ncbi:MAG: carbonic anhydrase [Acetobacteraceae bacterium]|nr:carbonic anhydrase [Acetobacteraceae bacterium]